MDRPLDAVVAGHLCIDVFPSFPTVNPETATISKILIPGKLVEVGPLTVSTGGPVSNTGIALLKLGVKAVLMGKTGTDEFGTLVKNILNEIGAGEHLIVAEGETTSYTVGLAIPGIDRIFLHHPGSNDTFCAEDVNYNVVAQARLFHIGYPPLMKKMYSDGGDELATILRRARELGTITSMDMALPDPDSPAGKCDWNSILRKTLPHVNIFLPSAEETLYMLDRPKFDKMKAQAVAEETDILNLFTGDDLAALSDKLLEYGCQVAVIKCGHRGIYIRTGDVPADMTADTENWSNRELWEPVFQIEKLVSAAGSGDSAIAGFLGAFLHGHSLEKCARYGTATGAENVEAMDAVSGVGTWDEITARINNPWEKVPLEPGSSGWNYDEARQTWFGPNDK